MKEFAHILTEELEPMWRFALRLTANQVDAEDLVQRTCVKALENAHLYKEKGRLRSWLFRIEHRIWLNVLRSRQIRSAGSFNTGAALATQPHSNKDMEYERAASVETVDENSPESNLQLHQIYLQVESLPDAQRLVVLLVCVEGFTYSETADVLEIPIGTVMSRLARARMTLGKAMLAKAGHTSVVEVDGGLQR